MSQSTIIDLSSKLKVKPKKVLQFLQVPVGKKVSQGELLAKKGKLFSKKVTSPLDAQVVKLETETGKLHLEPLDNEAQSDEAKDAGKDASKSSKKPKSSQLQPQYSWGEGQGKLVRLKKTLNLKTLDCNMAYQFVWAKSLKSQGAVFKAEALDLAGVVVLTEKTVEELEKHWQKTAQVSDLAVVFLAKSDEKKLKKLLKKEVKFKKGSLVEA